MNEAKHARELTRLLNAGLAEKYPHASATHPETARERLFTYGIHTRGPRGYFEVCLNADDAMVTRDRDDLRVARLLDKIDKYLHCAR